METPRYSIITVCLNAKEELKKTLSSIEQQTYRNFEWIIIDGQSKDGTVDIVRNHPCVTHLVSEPDVGIYDAMNKGIKFSSGDYFLFLNAGDLLYSKNTLQKVDRHLNDELVVGDLAVVKKRKIHLKKYAKYGLGKKYCYNQSFPHQSTFIKREVFEIYGCYCNSFKIRGDHDFFAHLMSNDVSFSFLNFCVAVFPVNGISFRMKNSELLKDELTLVRKRNFSIVYRIKMKIFSLLA